MKKLLNIGLTVGFLAIFIIYFLLNKSDFKVLANLKIYYILVIAILQIAVIFVNGVFFIAIQEGLNLKMNQKEGFLISVLSSIGNYFTPFRGGMGIRAVYLKKKHNFPYSKFITTLAGNYIIVFLINSLVALISITLLLAAGKNIDYKLILIFGLIFIGLLFLSLFPTPVNRISKINFKFLNPFVSKLLLVVEGWNILVKNKKLLLKLALLTLINLILGIALYFFELRSIGIHTNILFVVIFSSISSISLLLSLTPGSLGIRESLLLLFQTSLNLTTVEILSSSIIDRVIYFFVMIFLGIILKLIGFNGKKDDKKSEPNSKNKK